MSGSKKGGPSLAVIDHAKMIEQGVFAARDSDIKTTTTTTDTSTSETKETDWLVMDGPSDLELFDAAMNPQQMMKKKSKKKRKKSKNTVIIQTKSPGVITNTVRTILNNRPLRTALILILVYMCVVGGAT